MSSDKQIEQKIQAKGLTAPRVTPDHIDALKQRLYENRVSDGAVFVGGLTSGGTIEPVAE